MTNNTNFDARTTMEEMNYLINVINEKWEQIVFNEQNGIKTEKISRTEAIEYQKVGYIHRGYLSNENMLSRILFSTILPFLLSGVCFFMIFSVEGAAEPAMWFFAVLMGLIGIIITVLIVKYYVEPLYRDKNSSELDYLIYTEWYSRMKSIRENASVFSSDPELRDAYTKFQKIDKEVCNRTVFGRVIKKAWADLAKAASIVGVVTLGTVAVTAGAIHSTGKNSFKYD